MISKSFQSQINAYSTQFAMAMCDPIRLFNVHDNLCFIDA